MSWDDDRAALRAACEPGVGLCTIVGIEGSFSRRLGAQLAVGPDGTIYYVATWLGAIIRVSPNGERTTLANAKHAYGDRGGPGAQAALRPADGLLLTPDGLVFTDTANNRIRSVEFKEPHNVITLLGGARGDNAPGGGRESDLNLPRAIASVADGYVVADTANHRLLHFSNDPLAGTRL